MIESLQIETTTRCTLRCPACSRTIFTDKVNKPYPHYDIDPDIVYSFLDCTLGKQIKTLNLCGDYGDSIYYPRLFEFLEKFKPTKTIRLTTNGSYRNEQFWVELCARLDKDDRIVFSIDGLEDTNHLYRINSDWKSIMTGLDVVSKSGIRLEWETNIFSFNYDKLHTIKEFAESKGARFTAKKTHRFGLDSLKPPETYVDVEALYSPKYNDSRNIVIIEPDCINRQRNLITAQHYYAPCGFMTSPNVYFKTALWKEREKWSIANTTLDQLHEQSLIPWVNGISADMKNAHPICKMKCKQNQVQIKNVDV